MNRKSVILNHFNYNNSKLVSGTQNDTFIELCKTFVVAFSFQEAAVKEDEEEVSDKGSDSEKKKPIETLKVKKMMVVTETLIESKMKSKTRMMKQ